MAIFTSYEQWFINTMDTIIQVSIIKYDISQYRLIRSKIQRYVRKMERLETPEEKQKMMNIIEVSELQLNAFPSLQEMYSKLNEIFKHIPFKEQFNKNSFQLKEEMTNIQKRKFDLLRWIRNSERSLFQLLQMELIKNNNNERSIRQKRNENRSREELKSDWVRLVLESSSENIRQAYRIKNNTVFNQETLTNENIKKIKNNASLLKKRYTNGLKENNFNLSLNDKKKHLKTNECSYDFEERTPLEKRDFLNEIERKKRNNANFSGKYNWKETLDMLGIDQLSFLKINKTDRLQNQFKKIDFKKALINLIDLYLIPIHENYSDVFLLYRENIMMCITFILYNNYTKLKIQGETIGNGVYGLAKLFNNKIYKYENLRIMTKKQREKGVENNGTLFTKHHKKYPINSYVPTLILFSYMIQKYLFNLNNNYVPDIFDIKFGNENKEPSIIPSENQSKEKNNRQLSLTIMNKAKKNERFEFSNNFYEILFNKELYELRNYIQFIKMILIKLCDILIYYQNNCYFVHHDLHVKNIIINFNKNSNTNLIDIENIQVKLIDFSFSSILINNESLILSQLQNSSLKSFHNPTFSNPYLNKEWKKIDLKYFFTLFFFVFKPFGLYQFNIKNNKLNYFNTSIEKLIIDIINIEPGYNERFSEFKNIDCFLGLKAFDVFLIKNNIFGESFDDNIFDPSICKQKIIHLNN